MAFDIPPLPEGQPLTQPGGLPSLAFTVYWQKLIRILETQETIQDDLIQDLADAVADIQIALITARARMPGLAAITVTADSSGTVNAGQLPRSVQFSRFDATTNVTTTSAWSAVLLTGSATFSIGAATGILEITGLVSSSTIEVTSVRDSVTLTTVFTVNKSNAAVGGSSGGGSSASDSSLSPFNSTSYAPVSDEISAVAGAGGVVTLTAADLVVSTAAAAPDGVFQVRGKWEWDSTGGGVWVDVGTDDLNIVATEVTDLGGGFYELSEGVLTCNEAQTGLTPATTHKFRFSARNTSGTRTMYLAGTVSAVGS